jgi:hypothetical protein
MKTKGPICADCGRPTALHRLMLSPDISLDVYDVIAAWFTGRCGVGGDHHDLREAAASLRRGLADEFPGEEHDQMMAAASTVLALIAQRFAEANADLIPVAGNA